MVTNLLFRNKEEMFKIQFNGAWEDATYEQIADRSGYSINYLQRDLGPKLWKLEETC